MKPDPTPVPLTLLSGFLGSGKTTLLNRMLSECGDMKLALLVNDVGEINIDASLVKTQLKELDDSVTQMVELSNGCICCSIQGDLAEGVEELVKTSGADHIVIEASGVAEPTQVLQALYAQDLFGKRVSDIAPINALVTVIDGRLLMNEWQRIHAAGAGKELIRPSDEQPVFELMVEQIECADFILLNKKDLLSEEEGVLLLGIVAGLNPRAQTMLATQSQVDISALLMSRAFTMEDTIGAPRWMQELENKDKPSESRFQPQAENAPSLSMSPANFATKPTTGGSDFASKYGLKTFIYRSRIPFKATKLSKFLESQHAGLLRVKGFAWIAERADQVALLSIAGDVNRCDFIGDWWATRFEKGQVKREQFPEEVLRSWQEPFGDRRQEIVFIGIGMNEAEIRTALDDCQLQAEDFSQS
jgi:G3E family GTPase